MNARISHLFTLTNLAETMANTAEVALNAMMQHHFPNTPFEDMPEEIQIVIPKFKQKMKERIPALLEERITPLVEEHISDEDIELLIEYYESEHGQRVRKASETLMSLFVPMGNSWGEEVLQEVLKEEGLE